MSKKTSRVEWVGGMAPMPAYVTGEGEPYRPEMLIWLSADGAVLGSDMAKPGQIVSRAADSLRSTIARPMFGAPSRPDESPRRDARAGRGVARWAPRP